VWAMPKESISLERLVGAPVGRSDSGIVIVGLVSYEPARLAAEHTAELVQSRQVDSRKVIAPESRPCVGGDSQSFGQLMGILVSTRLG